MRVRPVGAVRKLLRPVLEFTRLEASSGILLFFCAVWALVWANSPWADSYFGLWQTTLTIGLGNWTLSKPVLLWINEGLMAIFFFVVGLEIKRELLVGVLASAKRAMLPIAAAVGGMLVPATVYIAFNIGTPGASGWGIPMATDIAFALGVLVLLGNRVPLTLKVFLTALAIVDDIGAVLVIALFYAVEISWLNLAIGAGFLISLVAVNRAGVQHPLFYVLLGAGLWLSFLQSGIHATVAGVLLAMTIPAQTRINTGEFITISRTILKELEGASAARGNVITSEKQQAAIQALEAVCEQVETPLQRLERALHPWVAYAIMPFFALANAGVSLGNNLSASLVHPVTLGVLAGLVLGKQIGVTLFAWLAMRSHLADLPEEISWRQIYGVGWLAGIGFTMSLFIAHLAFGGTPLLSVAKVGILLGSLISGVVGWMILRGVLPQSGVSPKSTKL